MHLSNPSFFNRSTGLHSFTSKEYHQYGKKPRLSAVPSSDEYNACLAKQNSFFSNLTKNLRNINPDCALLTVVENDNKENVEILDVDIVCDDNVGANEEISTSKQTEEVVISSSTPNSTGTIANTNMSTLKTNRPVSRPMENAARIPLQSLEQNTLCGSTLQSAQLAISSKSKCVPIKLPIVDKSAREMELPTNLSEDARQFFNNSVKVDLDKAFKIESSTRNQSDSHAWFTHRQYRLTASNFGKVLKRKKEDCSKLVSTMTTCTMNNLNVSSLRYGRENESLVAKYYVQFQEKYGHAGIQIFPCGLVVNPLYSWLGASPDRIVFDPTSNPPYGRLEIKCIESGKGMTPLQTYYAKREPILGKKKPFCLVKQDDNLILIQNHCYYDQAQGQCAVSGLKWNDFVLMTDLELGDKGIHVQRIYFDESWHKSSLIKLTHFYFSKIMPTLV